MKIPYNEAGQQAFETFRRVAEKLYNAAQEAVDEWMAQNCPDGEILGERHADGRYQRRVRTADGLDHTISYDYRTKEVAAA